MSEKILGIDRGSFSIKVAEIERHMGKFQLVGFYEQPVVTAENVSREQAETQALQKLFEEYNLKPDHIYTALPGQLTSNRVIDLPFSDFKKVDQTIEFEMENYIPLTLEEMLIDYIILNSTKTESRVLVSYSTKSDFVQFLNFMNTANVDPRFVGSETVELGNVMKLGVLQPEGAYALIDIGHEKTNIVIFIGNQLQFSRTVMFGGKDLTQSIADALNVPLDEAERLKVDMGHLGSEADSADATTRAISDAIKKPMDDILLSLKQTFLSFQQTRGEVVQALLLCGGTSRLPGIDQYIEKEIHKNVSFLDCLDFPFNHLADSSWCRPVAVTALSLAYRGILGSTIRDVQFRRGEFAYQGEVKDLVSLTKQVAVLLGVIFVFASVTFGASYFSLKGKAKSQMAKITSTVQETLPDIPKKSLSSPNTILSTLNSKISEAEDKRKRLKTRRPLLFWK
ncbi:MAG: pilus assembly protein PilM [Deltaproteobacteria bacterium]|nr:MAG: pilus assembly protein PilM [Deltaproteobacteria bacterium]